MQNLTAPPRDSLTAAQVTALLTGPQLTVSAGAELLASDLTFVADISDDVESGQVQWSAGSMRTVSGLNLSRPLSWGTDLIRPYMTLTDGSVEARFNLGVFSLTTPARPVGVLPETYSCQGYDRLYLLNRPVGDTYTVPSGTAYLTAVADVVADAGLTGLSLDTSAAAKTLPTDMTWPLLPQQGSASTWLGIVNDLLGAIAYRGLWADENGLFRSEPYLNPADRAAEFTFTTDTVTTIVGEDRVFEQDVWQIPNKWVFVQQNPTSAPTEGAGQYTVDDLGPGLTSQTSRGLVWPKVLTLPAADQASLEAQGDVIVAADLRVAASLKVSTGPFPLAGSDDVYVYRDAEYAAGADVKVQAASWTLDLTGGDTQWVWSVV